MVVLEEHEDELRADLQQYYGIDLDAAMEGAHTAYHIAALLQGMPKDSRVNRAYNPDAAWTLEATLMAAILNNLRGFIWGMSDKRKRGKMPDMVGPSYMAEKNKVTLPARVLPIEKLLEELEKPRR